MHSCEPALLIFLCSTWRTGNFCAANCTLDTCFEVLIHNTIRKLSFFIGNTDITILRGEIHRSHFTMALLAFNITLHSY
jgi:hypothetical protein